MTDLLPLSGISQQEEGPVSYASPSLGPPRNHGEIQVTFRAQRADLLLAYVKGSV